MMQLQPDECAGCGVLLPVEGAGEAMDILYGVTRIEASSLREALAQTVARNPVMPADAFVMTLLGVDMEALTAALKHRDTECFENQDRRLAELKDSEDE